MLAFFFPLKGPWSGERAYCESCFGDADMVGGGCGRSVHGVEVRNGVVRMVEGADRGGLCERGLYERRRENRTCGLEVFSSFDDFISWRAGCGCRNAAQNLAEVIQVISLHVNNDGRAEEGHRENSK